MTRHERIFPAAILAVSSLLSGCVPVQPLEPLRSNPGEHLVQIRDHRVYTERIGEGPPVLLLHGFGASTYSWRKVVPALAEHHQVVAFDLYGFGWTDRPEDRTAYTRDGQVRLVLDLMSALGLEAAHVVGHSYGGSIAMALAAEHPERVRSLILVDAAAVDYPMSRRKWYSRFRLFNWVYVRGLALRTGTVERVLEGVFYDDHLATDELIAAYLERLRVEGAAIGYRGLTRPLPGTFDSREIRYQEIAVPTLVIWGAQDQLIGVEAARYYAGMFPNARFVVIEAAGHAPMEEKPKEFMEQVIAFLDAVERRDQGSKGVSRSLDELSPVQSALLTAAGHEMLD